MTLKEQHAGDHRELITVVGGSVGALIGGIASMAVGRGAIAIPGLGPAITEAPLAVAIGSVGIGAVAGGFVGSLMAGKADRQSGTTVLPFPRR